MSVTHSDSWVQRFKSLLGRMFFRRGDRRSETVDQDRPIATQEMADLASEDSFPASDPPSYTGSIT